MCCFPYACVGVRIMILNTHAKYAWPILAQARRHNMFSSGWAWIVTDGVTLSNLAIPTEAESEADQYTTDSMSDTSSFPQDGLVNLPISAN